MRGWAGSEEMLTVTFQNSSRLDWSGKHGTDFSFLISVPAWADVFGTRQEYGLTREGFTASDQSGDKSQLQLESLILAQNERWRQA